MYSLQTGRSHSLLHTAWRANLPDTSPRAHTRYFVGEKKMIKIFHLGWEMVSFQPRETKFRGKTVKAGSWGPPPTSGSAGSGRVRTGPAA